MYYQVTRTTLTGRITAAVWLLLVIAAVPLFSQNRDFSAERLILDDDANDGGRNTLTLQVPPAGLSANRTLTFPDADGFVVTTATGLTANQILFGDAAGQVAQSASLLWDDGTGIFDIGTGNFTVDATTGNTVIGGTLDQQGAVSNSTGDVVVNDDANVTGSLDVDTDLNVDGTTTLVGAVDAQAAGNVIGDGTDAEQLEVQGVDGGAVEVDINGDADVSGTLTVGTLNLGLTQGSVTFADALGNITEDNTNLFWDDANNRLGVGNNIPAEALDVTGNIVASGTIQSGASIIIDGTTPGSHNISTSGAEDLTIAPGGGDLAVTGNTNVTGSLDVDTDLNVDGNTVHVGTLDQQGAVSSSTGDVVVNDDANVTGSLDVDTDLNVDGNSTHVGTLDQQGAVSNSTGDVVVNDDANVTGSLDVDTDLNVDGNTVHVGTLDQQGAVSNSTGDVVVNDDANVTGSLDVDTDLNVDGNTVHVGTLDQQGAVSNSTGDVVINDDANVTGSLDVDTDLNVDGTTTLVGAVDAQAAGNLIGDGTDAEQLQVDGVDGGAVEVDINGDMDVSGTLTAGTLNLGLTPGSVTFADALGNIAEDNTNLFWDDVNNRLGIGNNVPAEALDVTGNIVASGTIQSGASIIIDGTTPGSHNISTSGAEDLTIAPGGGDLAVTGNTNITGSLDVDTDLNVDGNTVHVGTLDQQGAVSNTTGDVVVNDDANVTGSLDVDTDLNVDGNTVHVGTLDQQGAISSSTADVVVNDNLDVNTNLNVDGTTTLVGAVDAQAAGNVIGDGTAVRQVTVQGAADAVMGNTVVGNPTVWDVVVEGDLAATGLLKAGGSIWIDGINDEITSNGSLSITTLTGSGTGITINSDGGTTTVDDVLLVTGDAVVNGTSNLHGDVINTTGDVTVGDNLNVTGSADVDVNLNVDGTTTLVGAVDAQGAGNTIGDGTDAEQLQVDGVDGGAVEVDVNGDMDVSGALSVGTLTLNGDLDMNDNDIFNVDELRGNSATGDLDINTTNTGDVNIGSGSGGINTSGTVTSTGDIVPSADNTYSLGTNALRWSDVFVNGGSVHVGDANGVGTDEMVLGYDGASTGTIGVNGATAMNITTTGVNVTGNADVDGTLNADGATTLNGAVTLGDAAADAITFTGQVASDIVPNADATYDLGSNTNRFDELFVSGPTIHIGSSADEAQISFNGGTGLELDGNDDGNSDLTIDGTTGDVTVAGALSVMGPVSFPASPLTLGDDTTPTPGQLNFEDNTAANGFQGTIQTVAALTADRTYTLPDASGVISLVGDIVTDATLTGDGSSGNPLGIDLTNANTWTGTQTLPVTAAQGDALIASTNAGTTTIDAARIGAGLTDAQVNDNLTINGGTVDATPVGATTPSTGAFTTITGTTLPAASTATDLVTSNGGALETRTIASLGGSIAVVTDATLLGDGTTGNPLGIDLTNPNSWTGAQTFSSVDVNGGTIDGTTIGGTTPAAGTFTTISDGAGTTITGGTVTATTLTDGIASMSGGTVSDGFGASMFGGTVTGFTLTDGIASMSGGTISDGFGASMSGGTVTGFTLTDGIASMSGGTISDGLGASMFGGTVTGSTLTDGIASMSGGTISDGFGASMSGGTVTGVTVTDGIASMSGGTISDGAGSTITGGSGTFATITGTGLPAASTATDLVTSNGGALETRTIASLGGSIAVSTDATLTGDGTTGDPLGIDLTNANTWTGTQTLPVTAAQGDALIASTNAGTTTIDAARIGAGLTDAQVNDNLTINGGTVDATPVGATTPSTGAFTTLDASGAITGGSTLTLGDDATPTAGTIVLHDNTSANTFTGTIQTADPLTANRTYTLPDASGELALVGGIVTDATLTGDGSSGNPLGIDLTNPNSWTGAQTFSSVDINGGTIDGTTIGATTPAAGTVTTLVATGTSDLQGAISSSTGDVVVNDNLDVTGTVNAAAQYNIGGSRVVSVQGTENTWVGVGTGASLTTGTGNVGVGTNALTANTSGNANIAVGANSLLANTTGAQNVAVGNNALAANTTANNNVGIGTSALAANTTGTNNIAVSTNALAANTTGINNIGIGANSLAANTTGGSNIGVGGNALQANTTGAQNIAVGNNALAANTIANNNIGVGWGALNANTTGTQNIAIGTTVLLTNTTGNSNIGVGYNVLAANTTGADNTALGDGAGATNTTGSDNTFIGSGADASAAALTNATAIGSGATVGQSNALILGNGADVGIGTSTPGARLDVNGTFNVSGTSTLVGAFDAQAAGNTIGDGTDAEQLQIDGVDGGAVEVDVNGDMDVSGSLSVGTLTLNGDLDLNDNDIFNVDELRGNSATGDLNVNTTNTGDINLGNGSGIVNVDANVIPSIDNTYSLGTDALRWSDVFVNGGSVHVGDANGVGTDEMVLGYDGTTTGTIGVNGTTAMNITTTGVNLTGNGDVDGNLNVDGNTVHVGTLDQQGVISNSTGNVTVSDDLTVLQNIINVGSLDQQGSVSNTLGDVTINDILAINTDGGTNLRIDETGFERNSAAAETVTFSNPGAGTMEVIVDGDLDVNTNMNVDGTITGGSTLTLGDDATPTAGTIVLHDNTSANTFTGTIQTADPLTANRTYTLPDASGELAVVGGIVTDATLTGDGSSGNPLGIDLTNANTWTGTQTLPVTAAQGDALIASTNAGTTTIDAARIGAGLTDAQVNDNLTINGGTVDATPVGATTPSTGAFTTITGTTLPAASTATDLVTSNGGALETRTIASLGGSIAVSTDATLTGDGTTGDPLGIDLTNANTWTGTQTLPVTAAQGDALIASTNAGTATIDAARIGAGLTDAQVNDNLTINGGTVDATPVGATTPSTGAFTTITGTALPAASTATDLVTSNGGALETRTIASLGGSIAVSTDATLTGDGTTGDPLGIDLTNANTWTGTQTLPVTAAQGDALIASTNAGTATIDAARIGAGLTDAQVNDNLTINGGTVDATPVGATTPSTGAFTTLDASGAITGGSTLTLGDDATPTAGTIVLHDNTSANTFTGTIQTTDPLTANRTYTLPDASGELALVGGIVTDATLTGDGSSGNPLGIDLTNANTWTGTQTLPVTAAQGDALIASTNAGTTTIDAARIGAGLTDAQVNDNLTINGGTVDATPVGATTPSTGAFTTITGTTLPAASTSTDIVTSNGGALETRTLASLAGEIGVSTDATLTGDGTTGSPLGIDLTNANTWTGTQTLPVTAAQGDALIASTNAGTTTVDAARIGAGLTDAQVNDNLTINGGTVDASPIGATTPSTGAFTTITGTTITGTALPAASTSTDLVTSNGGALETRTIASLGGSIAVSTDATLTGDGTTGDPLGIDLTNANTWTGTQTLPVTVAQGDALIASTNAGTTTIDAARIGAGLTDAQVNDNLTINGGTVDASPVGATTPSTGAFTTLTATNTFDAQAAGNLIGDGTDAEQLQIDGVDGGAVEVDVNGDMDVSGTLTVGTLTLNGDLDMNDNDIFNVDELRGNSATGDLNVNTTNTGDINLGNGTGDVNVDANVIPSTDNTYSLGTDALRWSDVFVNGGSVHVGDASGVGTDEMVLGYDGATTGTIGVNGTTAMNITTTGVNFTGSADVDGTLNADGATTLNGNVTLGDALTDVTTFSGQTVHSYGTVAAGATITIPGNTTVVAITDDAAATANAITMPAGTNGQVLYIHNGDAQATTTVVINSNATAQFVYALGAWQRVGP